MGRHERSPFPLGKRKRESLPNRSPDLRLEEAGRFFLPAPSHSDLVEQWRAAGIIGRLQLRGSGGFAPPSRAFGSPRCGLLSNRKTEVPTDSFRTSVGKRTAC